jgi:hypothetical protein
MGALLYLLSYLAMGRPGWNRTTVRLRIREPLEPTELLAYRGERATRTPAFARPAVFGTAPAALAGSLSTKQETENSNLRARAPTRFPGGDHHLVMSSPTELEERAGFEPARALPDPAP